MTKKKIIFDIYSDLHVNQNEEQLDYKRLQNADRVIIAGDISQSHARSAEEVKKIAAVYKSVHILDGNYEFWEDWVVNRQFNIAATQKKLVDTVIAAAPNVSYLRDKPIFDDGVAIVGRNTHWDFRGNPDITREDVLRQQMERYKLSREVALMGPTEGDREVADLGAWVSRFNRDRNIDTGVIVTHSPPYLPGTGYLETSPGAPPIVMSTMTHTGTAQTLKHDFNNVVKFWISGHMHKRKTMLHNGVLYVSNPRVEGMNTLSPNYGPVTIDFSRPPDSAIRNKPC